MSLEVVWPMRRDHYLTIPASELPEPKSLAPPRLSFLHATDSCRYAMKSAQPEAWFTSLALSNLAMQDVSVRTVTMIGDILRTWYATGVIDRRVSDRRGVEGAKPFEYRWKR